MDTDSELQDIEGATTEMRADTGATRNLIYYRRRWAASEESNPCAEERGEEEEEKSERWCHQQHRDKKQMNGQTGCKRREKNGL